MPAAPVGVVSGMGQRKPAVSFEIGQQLGHLTVLREVRKPHGDHTRLAYVCGCVCGTETTILAYNLKRTRSCGCQGKTCSKCGKAKPLSEFKVGPGLHARSVWCRQCYHELYEQNVDEDPFFARRQTLWTRYRMTLEEYDAKLSSQGGVCAMCSEVPEGPPHVDHDHACCPGKFTCGKCVRDILCGPCNRLVGVVESARGQLALAYVTKWKGREVVTCPQLQ